MSTALEVTAFEADGTARPRAVKLPADPFDGLVHESAMHQAVKVFMANQRQGTVQTKTRGYVSGGNQKPWRQKGTGRARQGSTRSPLWPGGGTMFGPHPREYRQAIPKKLRQLARRSALNARAQEQALTVIAPLAFEEPKTKRMAELIRNMGLDGHRVLVLTSELKSNVVLSARNIPDVDVMRYGDASTYDILHADAVVIEEPALGTLESGGEVTHRPAPKKRRTAGQAESRTEGGESEAPAKRKGKSAGRPSARPPVRTAKAAKSAPKPKAAAKAAKPKASARKPAAKKPGKKKD
ncbi:MAG: 50S ribosomal protein L4 [Gemmatimonadales bacterium]